MRHSPAFTLIELIVVLALIGLLTGLGYTQFSKFQESSAQNLAISQLKNYFTLARSYAISRQVPTNSKWTDIDGVMVSVNNSTKKIDILGKSGAETVSYLAQPADITGGVILNLNSPTGLTVEFNKYKGDVKGVGQNCVSGGTSNFQNWCVQLTGSQSENTKCLVINSSGFMQTTNEVCDFVITTGLVDPDGGGGGKGE